MYCRQQQQQNQNSASMGHHQLSAAQTFRVDDKTMTTTTTTTTTTTAGRAVSKSCFSNDSISDFWFHESINNMTNSSAAVKEEEDAVLFVLQGPQQQGQLPSSHHHAGVVGYYDPDYDQHHQLTTGNGTTLGSSTSVCSLINNNLAASTMQHNNMINGFKTTNNGEGVNLKQLNNRLDRNHDHQNNWSSARNHQSENPCANNSSYYNGNHKSSEFADRSSISTTKASGITSIALNLFPTTGTTISFDFGQSGNQHMNGLYRHSSLPSTLYGANDTPVALNLRAKRGCATHPRSIAERLRRKRISQRMKRLQELFPNLDKQTSTSDMLEMAVDHIKQLQNHLAMLADTKQKCTCSPSRSLLAS